MILYQSELSRVDTISVPHRLIDIRISLRLSSVLLSPVRQNYSNVDGKLIVGHGNRSELQDDSSCNTLK